MIVTRHRSPRYALIALSSVVLGFALTLTSPVFAAGPLTLQPGERVTVTCESGLFVGPHQATEIELLCAPIAISPTSTPTASATATATPAPTPTPSPPSPSPTPTPTRTPTPRPSEGIFTSAAELADNPTSGSAWNALKATADGSWGSPNLSDQNNKHGVHTLSGALVYARTGEHRAKVVNALEAAVASDWRVSNGTELGISRNLGAYVIAADLIGYRTSAFEAWITELLDSKVDTHPIWNVVRETSEITANNHGTFALASRVAASAYLGDRADLDRSWAIFTGYLDGSWDRFRPTADYDSRFQCGGSYIPINPPCVRDGHNFDGLPVDDAGRGDYPNPHGGYILEAIQGYVFMGVIFERAGYPAFAAGDNAILRVANAQQRFGIWNYHRVGYHVAPLINHVYGTSFAEESAGFGRLLGWTDWIYGD